jgi:hypothetical protein
MGMFDTVHFNCPSCNKLMEVQTKAGDCNLRIYHSDEVPLGIADDLNGDKEECGNCHTKLVIKLRTSNRAPLFMMPAIYCDDDEDYPGMSDADYDAICDAEMDFDPSQTKAATTKVCRLCGEDAPSSFNIKFKPVPICENCANQITIQQVQDLTAKGK